MKKVIVLLALLALTSTGAVASVEDQIAMVRQLAATERQAIVTENMGLTEAESEKFWPLYRKYRKAMEPLGDRTVALIQNYTDNYHAMTDEKAGEIVKEWFEIERKKLNKKKRFTHKFRKIISEIKVARLLQIENKIDAVYDLEMTSKIPLVN